MCKRGNGRHGDLVQRQARLDPGSPEGIAMQASLDRLQAVLVRWKRARRVTERGLSRLSVAILYEDVDRTRAAEGVRTAVSFDGALDAALEELIEARSQALLGQGGADVVSRVGGLADAFLNGLNIPLIRHIEDNPFMAVAFTTELDECIAEAKAAAAG